MKLIDAERLRYEMSKSNEEHTVSSREMALLFRNIMILNEQPAVECQPVIHAHWIETGTGDCIECSECGYEPSADVKESEEWDDGRIGNICPSCGAIMIGDNNNVKK